MFIERTSSTSQPSFVRRCGCSSHRINIYLRPLCGPCQTSAFWAGVLSELKSRGVRDIFVACMDGLKGLPEAVTALFPQTLTQQCIVHLMRASMRYVASKDMKDVAAAAELAAFEEAWGGKYRAAVRVWRNAWDNMVPLFQFPPEIRQITYTTNAIESLNATMRKYTRNRRIFPNDESALKSLYPGDP